MLQLIILQIQIRKGVEKNNPTASRSKLHFVKHCHLISIHSFFISPFPVNIFIIFPSFLYFPIIFQQHFSHFSHSETVLFSNIFPIFPIAETFLLYFPIAETPTSFHFPVAETPISFTHFPCC
jgi:hypothetical protein